MTAVAKIGLFIIKVCCQPPNHVGTVDFWTPLPPAKKWWTRWAVTVRSLFNAASIKLQLTCWYQKYFNHMNNIPSFAWDGWSTCHCVAWRCRWQRGNVLKCVKKIFNEMIDRMVKSFLECHAAKQYNLITLHGHLCAEWAMIMINRRHSMTDQMLRQKVTHFEPTDSLLWQVSSIAR